MGGLVVSMDQSLLRDTPCSVTRFVHRSIFTLLLYPHTRNLRMQPTDPILRTSLIAALAGWFSLAGGCAALTKTAAGPACESYRDNALLDAPTLLVEVDHIAGETPRPRALKIFERRLGFYGEHTDGIEVRVDDEIPADEWEESAEAIVALALAHADHRPADGAYLYVLYAPRWKRYRGYSFRVGRVAALEFPVMVAFTDQLKPVLWLTGVRQEASVLVHEAGHVLGLVTNDAHRDGGHCTNAWCLMYDGVDARSLAVHLFPTLFTGYLPTHFCRDCRADLWDEGVVPGQQRLPGMPTPERPGCDPNWEESS